MPNPTPTNARFPRGAVPSPRQDLAAATPHVMNALVGAPSSFLMWPKQMAYWNNSTYGDCVSAEEAFAKATAAPQVFIPEATVVAWATQHGYLNGATLTSVMSSMRSEGFPLDNKVYDDGPYNSVNWHDAGLLQNAIFTLGPVKLGVAADDFQGHTQGHVTPGTSGWAMFNYPKNLTEDHCTSLCGYGNLADLVALFKQRGVTVNVPAGMPTGMCYAMFTWNSIGIIDQQSMLNMTYEAWVRNPVTVVANGEFVQRKKIINTESTPKAPAIASLNGRLYLAWKGDGNDRLNVMYSADNGASFSHKYIADEASSEAPSLCVHNGALYMAWKGSGNNKLNVAQVAISGDNITGVVNKKTLADTSPLAPSITSFAGRLFIAWKGDGNDNLNVMVSGDNGATFGGKFTSPETSSQAPAIAGSANYLFIAWKGSGNDNLNAAHVDVGPASVTGFSSKSTFADTSVVAPSLVHNNGTCLSWVGKGNDFLNVMTAPVYTTSFGNKMISAEKSPQPTSMCVHNGAVYIAWKGDGNDFLNVAAVNA